MLTEEDIAIKSPNDGLAVYEFENVLGMRLTAPLKADDNILYEMLENVEPRLKAAAGRG